MTKIVKGELYMTKNYHCGDLYSPALEAMLDKKLAKLDKFGIDGVLDIYMKSEGKDQFELKIQLSSKDMNLLAKSVSKDMYKNIDICVDKLNSQIVANK